LESPGDYQLESAKYAIFRGVKLAKRSMIAGADGIRLHGKPGCGTRALDEYPSMTTRIFLLGVIILFVGFQLRAVETFVLNEKVTKIINSRNPAPAVEAEDPYAASYYDPYLDEQPAAVSPPANKEITPPRWLGWSFVSIGAVLIVTCPCFRS
jgi:hypothetical protein